MDKIIIPSKNNEERLTQVLDVASSYGLRLNLKKCKFLKRKIYFFSHGIENGTHRLSQEKIQAIRNYLQPDSAKTLNIFLGLTSFSRKFIPGYAYIAKPFNDLLRKGTIFYFCRDQLKAFENLKEALTQDPILQIYRQGAKQELHTHGSKFGYESVLFQTWKDSVLHPIACLRKKTSPQEEKYSSFELEVLAIIPSLLKFRIRTTFLNCDRLLRISTYND